MSHVGNNLKEVCLVTEERTWNITRALNHPRAKHLFLSFIFLNFKVTGRGYLEFQKNMKKFFFICAISRYNLILVFLKAFEQFLFIQRRARSMHRNSKTCHGENPSSARDIQSTWLIISILFPVAPQLVSKIQVNFHPESFSLYLSNLNKQV